MVDKAHFISLPEPPFRGDAHLYNRVHPESQYLRGIELYITSLHSHLLDIQLDETRLINQYRDQLRDHQQQRLSEQRSKQEEKDKREFEEIWQHIKNRRKNFRFLEYDAFNERRKLVESMKIQKAEEEFLRRRLQRIGVHDKDPHSGLRGLISVDWIFFILFAFAEIATIAAAFVGGADFEDNDDPLFMNGTRNRIADYYTFYIPIALFVIVGFGLLYSFLRKYAYSALGFGLLIWCWAFQWTILTRIFWDNVDDRHGTSLGWERGPLNIWQLINGMYGAATCLITFGALLGRVRPVVLMWIVWGECMFYNLNYYLVVDLVNTVDFAGPMTVHIFGALFGIMCSFALAPLSFYGETETRSWNVDRIPSYNSNTFSLLGMLIMVATYPAFNAAFATDGNQFRVVIATILAVVASVIAATVTSKFFWGKISPFHVQMAATAGGVAIAAATAEVVNPAGALIIGAFVGVVCVISLTFLNPAFEYVPRLRWTVVLDPAGVFSSHFVPGLLGAIAGIIGVAIQTNQYNTVWGVNQYNTFTETTKQAGHQTAGLFITIGMAIGGGLLIGFIAGALNYLMNLRGAWKQRIWFSDQEYWIVPTDYEWVAVDSDNHPIAGGTTASAE